MRRVFKFDVLASGLSSRASNVVPGSTRSPTRPAATQPPTSSTAAAPSAPSQPISALLQKRHTQAPPTTPATSEGKQQKKTNFRKNQHGAKGAKAPHGIYKPPVPAAPEGVIATVNRAKDEKKHERQRAAIAARYGADDASLLASSVAQKTPPSQSVQARVGTAGINLPKVGPAAIAAKNAAAAAAAAAASDKAPARGGFAARIKRQQDEAAAAAAAAKQKAKETNGGVDVVEDDDDDDELDDADDDDDVDADDDDNVVAGDVATQPTRRVQSGAALAAAAVAAASAPRVKPQAVDGEDGAPVHRSRTEQTEQYLKRQQSIVQNKKKQSQARRAAQNKSSQPKAMTMPSQPTAKSLANAMQCRTVDVLKTMIKLGESPLSSEEPLVVELAEMIASDRGFEILEAAPIPASQLLEARPQPPPEVYATLPRRPPVVCIVGHIDHGKTTLLDRLRKSRIAAGEAGGITQAIGSFTIQLSGGERCTFIDTPGHVAFQTMRARGVNVTDVALLVVAADAGIQEQTLQALATVRESSSCKLIVVVTKCDLPEVKPERVALEFTKHGVNAESLGGDVPFVMVSAKLDTGMDELEQQLLLTAEELNLRADLETGAAEAVVLEAETDTSTGSAASVVVRRGTLSVGDVFVCGTTVGRVRALIDDKAAAIKSTTPGSAVILSGFRELPAAGDEVFVVESERVARRYAEVRQHLRAQADMSKRHHEAALAAAERRRSRIEMLQNEASQLSARNVNSSNVDELSYDMQRFKSEQQQKSRAAAREALENEYPKSMVLMLKAQTVGALEALTLAVEGLPDDDDVEISISQSSVGELNDGDVENAVAIGAVVVLYGVSEPSARARLALQQHEVTVISSPIIYRLLDSIKDEGAKLLRPVETVTLVGRALIQKLFVIDANSSRSTTIAGSRVVNGIIKQASHVRVVKQGEAGLEANQFVLGATVPMNTLKTARLGRIRTLRHLKEAVKEVKKDTECGIDLQGVGDFSEGDFIDCFAVEYKKRAWGDEAAPPPIFEK
jgi:translation initiation factor IF-2